MTDVVRNDKKFCAYCNQCVKETVLSFEEVGSLKSRDYGLNEVSTLSGDLIGSHKGEPSDWLSRIEASILLEGLLQPLLLRRSDAGNLELLDGNHRAWIVYKLQISAPVCIFEPSCGKCSEASFCEAAMEVTGDLGWRY